MDQSGERKRCFKCESVCHMIDRCPHRGESSLSHNENRNRNPRNFDNAFITHGSTLSDRDTGLARGGMENAYSVVESVVLYAGNNESEMLTFCQESINCGILRLRMYIQCLWNRVARHIVICI